MWIHDKTKSYQSFPQPIGDEWRYATQEEINLINSGKWNPFPITKESIASRRYDAEIGGMNIDGIEVDTDDRSKLLINGAAFEATLNPEYTMQWKTTDGFIQMDAQMIIFIARAVRGHVQACFDREAELLVELEAGTITDAMLDEGWPNERLLHFMA